ncbi:MAG: site-specific integrase [Desulfuromonadales bacterium]|nr:site-specific integrase [Desulfuromonadales bacterium]
MAKRDPKNIVLRQHTHASVVLSSEDVNIDVSGDIWLIDTSAATWKFDFKCHPIQSMIPELRDYGFELLTRLQHSSVCSRLHVNLQHLPKYLKKNGRDNLDWADLTVGLLGSYLDFLRSKGTGYYFWHLRDAMRWVYDNRPGLIRKEIFNEICEWKIEGNVKGEAVLFGDVDEGALTIEEAAAIRFHALSPDSPVTLLERASTILVLETGRRNEAICKLSTHDFKSNQFVTSGDPRRHEPEQVVVYQVSVPSNKTLSGKKEISISRELFELCLALARSNQNHRSKFEDSALLIVDPEIENIQPFGLDADKQRWNKVRRPNSYDIDQLVKNFCRKCGIKNRNGQPIKISFRRFRRTIATRMIEQGASPEQVAVFLDHADTQQVMVYFEFMKNRRFERLENAGGDFYRTFGDHIAGRLISGPIEARNPELILPIFDPEKQDLVGCANCGRDLDEKPSCYESTPYACYECPYLEPWETGVHEIVLRVLKNRRDTLAAAQGRIKGNLIDSLDSLIARVSAVVDAVATRVAGKEIHS